MISNHTPTPPSAQTVFPEETVMQKNMRILLAALRAGGATGATIRYEGSGDSGDITQVEITTANGDSFDAKTSVTVFVEQQTFHDGQLNYSVIEQVLPIEDALRDFASEALEQHHGGWENHDGASGQMIFLCNGNDPDAADDTDDSVSLEHTSYFTESDYSVIDL